jgi:hypothetical protein
MAVQRGSTSKLIAIKEATAGVTPTTPTMVEMPYVSFTPKHTQNTLRSEQIRSHPFVDRILQGRFMHEFGLDFELQQTTHDMLLETFFGGAITTKALVLADVLKSLSIEEQVGGGSSLFNQFTYGVFPSLSITAGAGDTTPVKVSMSGMTKTGTLDAGATISSVITAAGSIDPFTFIGASLTVAAGATAVSSGTINLERAIDPLVLWNSADPREFVAGAVTARGSITVPYDTGAQSTLVAAFTSAALVFTFGNVGGTIFRKFTFPKAKLVGLGRPVNGRGARMQEIDWEAFYDTSSSTVCTMTTE